MLSHTASKTLWCQGPAQRDLGLNISPADFQLSDPREVASAL